MKKIILLALIAITLGSCSSLKIISDSDKNVDFNKFKTYSFYGWKGDIDNLTKQQISDVEKAIGMELNQRGLSHTEVGGDLVLSFFIVVDKQTTQNRYNGYYGYGTYGFSQPAWGWGSGVYFRANGLASPSEAGVPYKENAYYQGTLVCDAFDNTTKKLAWQGVVSKAINPEKLKAKRTIPEIVEKLMQKFPLAKKE